VLDVRVSTEATGDVLAVPVEGTSGQVLATAVPLDEQLAAELQAFAADAYGGAPAKAGAAYALPRPTSTPRRVILVSVGAGDEADWRAAGAAIARLASKEDAVTVVLSENARADATRGLCEGLWLASYSFSLKDSDASEKPLRDVSLLAGEFAREEIEDAVDDARAVAVATRFARDLTNMPSDVKSPSWFADEVQRVSAGNPYLSVRILAGDELRDGGFGGIVAVGSGSVAGPRLVELSYQPPDASGHVVLVGKGITFDSGGISIKPRDGMKLMRKDMGGAAAVIAATLGAAELEAPVRITALAPLAENMASGSAWRPGDVVTHYGGMTSEVLNTDAEGRVVLADALAYAASVLKPDVLVDLATLTGANAVALGKRTGALYSDNDELADALTEAATAAGERVWRMPLHDEYLRDIRSDVADIANSSSGGAGSITAALFLREFTGESRSRWAHIDMSAPSWADGPDGELVKGATGWGVRTLMRWFDSLDLPAATAATA
jgi:leucyl aminopeptidase